MRYRTGVRLENGTDKTITFDEFRQVVRRYKPSELLPALAWVAARQAAQPFTPEQGRTLAPWAIALIARESILWGNEHRDTPVDQEALRRLTNAHNQLYEGEGREDDLDLLGIFTPLAYEQFPYQESIFEEVSRTHALLIEGLHHTDTQVLNEEAWATILGAPLDDIVGATFVLQVGANENGGWFDPTWLDTSDHDTVFRRWPRDLIRQRLHQLTYTHDEFKAAYDNAPKAATGNQRYTFNPLTARPFIRMPNGRHLAPQPQLILRTVSPGSLYYAGIARLDPKKFGSDLGQLTEHYVGEQLRTIASAEVHPEIKYGTPEQKSIDWFLVLPSLVVMFEVKSTRFGLTQRAAEGHREQITTVIGGAINQLTRTENAINQGHPAFAHIPTDRSRIGIVTTAEPYYLANSDPARELLNTTTFPTLVASLRDIEMLVTLPSDQLERHLATIANDPDPKTWHLNHALDDIQTGHDNPILMRAWDTYFRDAFAHLRSDQQ